MTDNDNNRQSENLINDLPSQEEIGDKPYYDDESAPTVQFPINNNQDQIEKPNGDIQIQYEEPPFTATDNDQYQNNYIDEDYSPSCRKNCCKNIRLIICSIIIIMVFVFDLVFQILSKINPFIFIDDIAIFIIAIFVIYYSCKHESVFNRKISHVILAVTIIGLGLWVLGFTQYKEKNDSGFATILYFIIPVRLVALFCIYAPFFNYPQ